MIEENLRRAVKTWADPVSPEQVDTARRRFLEKVKGRPASRRFGGIATVAASLVIAAAVFWSVVSFKAGPAPGVAQDPSKSEEAELELLVKQLGADDAGERQKAMDQLKKRGRRILVALRRMFARAEDPEIRARLEEILDADGHPTFVLSEEPGIPGGEVAWSPDGREIAVLTGPYLKVYDTKSWKLKQSTQLRSMPSLFLAYDPSGKHLLAVQVPMPKKSGDPAVMQLVAIDARDLAKTSVVSSISNPWAVTFLDGGRIVFHAEDPAFKGLRVAAPAQGSWGIRDVYPMEMMSASCVASPDGKWIGLLVPRIDILDPGTWVKKASLPYPMMGASGNSAALAFSPDSRWMVVEAGGGDLVVYEAGTWKQAATWNPHGRDVGRFQFTPDSRYLVTVGSGRQGSDATLRAWRFRDRREVASVALSPEAKVAVCPVDDRIVTCTLENPAKGFTLRIYRLKPPE